MSDAVNANFTELYASSTLFGVATLDFGDGSLSASAVITGIDRVLSNSLIRVDTRMEATPEHSLDELLIDPIQVNAHSLVVGVGFTITGRMDNAPANGTYIINWAVN
tara:strand:- start:3937 stop:4257 length:321 start_codon:yes stop_codon:yes gene_type:complete